MSDISWLAKLLAITLIGGLFALACFVTFQWARGVDALDAIACEWTEEDD